MIGSPEGQVCMRLTYATSANETWRLLRGRFMAAPNAMPPLMHRSDGEMELKLAIADAASPKISVAVRTQRRSDPYILDPFLSCVSFKQW